jgi:hypothetical protein
MGSEPNFALVVLFSLSGLDLSLWLETQPWFVRVAEIAAALSN